MAETQEPSIERRFFAFIVTAVGVLMLFNFWQARNAPPQRNVEKPAGLEEKEDGAAAPAPEAKSVPPAAPEGPAVEPPAIAAEPPAELQYLTLGSVDRSSPYRMLVTATNAGAGVRRVELSSPQFRDLNDRSGYLGHLELVDDKAGGARARIVSEGTPAFKSGLRAGDVITAISLPGKQAATPVAKSADLRQALADTEPRDEIRLTIRRDGADKQLDPAMLTRRPLEVIRPESENIRLYSQKVPDGHVDQPSFIVQLQSVDGLKADDPAMTAANVALATGNWQVEAATPSSVGFRQRLPALGLEVVKRYQLKEVPANELSNDDFPAYDFELDCEIRNLNGQPRKVVYLLRGPNGLPIESWWYATKVSRTWSSAGLRDVLVRFPNQGTTEESATGIAKGKTEALGAAGAGGDPLGALYAGVDAQYFASMILPVAADIESELFTEVRSEVVGEKLSEQWPQSYTNVSFRMVRTPIELQATGQPRDKVTDKFQVFNGPKRPSLLAQYVAAENPSYTLADILTYGWFGPVAKLMLAILHAFYAVVRNYGIAIIMLTVLVRGLMFPLSRKQALNMAKMQELKPEIDRIAEKFKNDVEKRTKAQQELFRKHSYNPMGGCLMMFIQLPIFIGLYRSLMVDVELRDAPLLSHALRWCSNLAAPDMLLDWSRIMPEWVNNGNGIFAVGPYLNVLPLVTVALFLVQQKMFMPPPANEQAAMQMKVMQYMMVFMGLLFYKVASGLCLYFIASSLWGMAERKLLPKPKPADAAPGAGVAGATSPDTKPAASVRNGAAKDAGKNRAGSKRKR